MSDSGFSQLPPGPRVFDPLSVQARQEQTVKIEAVRGDGLRDLNRTTRVEGVVTQVTPDGLATIRTDQGDEIDIRLRGRVVLQEGQRIEVELPPGHPPRQAAIRPLPEGLPQAVQIPVAEFPQTVALPIETGFPNPQRLVTAMPTVPPELRALLDKNIAMTARPMLSAAAEDIDPKPLSADTMIRLVPLLALPPPDRLAPLPVPVPVLLPGEVVQPLVFQPIRQDSLVPDISRAGISGNLPPPVLQLTTPSEPALIKPMAGSLDIIPPWIFSVSPPAFISIQAIDVGPKIGMPSILQPMIGKIFEPLNLSIHPAQPVTIPADHDIKSFNIFISTVQSDRSIKITSPDGIVLPEKGNPLLSSISSPMTIPADVIAITRENFPILSVFLPGKEESHLFLAPFPAETMVVGSRVQILPAMGIISVDRSVAPLSTPIQHAIVTPAFDLFSGWTWPVLDEVTQILAQGNSLHGSTPQNTANILPSPGNPAQMPHALLFFIAAVRSGDLAGWMGEKAIEILRRDGERRGGDLLSRLARDMGGLSKTLADPVSQDWRGVTIPLYWQNEIQKMNLFYRHQNGGQDDDAGNPDRGSTRFIFDLYLDRMGDVQLDGLMKGKHLDLILRTKTVFSRAMQVVMRQRYLEVLESGGLIGDMGFQTRADQWIKVGIRPSGLETMV